MNIKQMEYVLEVYKTGSFSRAAENLYITQPALSYAIKALEQEIGFPVFIRTRNGVTLNPSAEIFIESVSHSLETLKTSIQMCRNSAAHYSDVIRLGLPYRYEVIHLPEAIIEFNKRFPEVNISTGHAIWEDMLPFLQGKQDIYIGKRSGLEDVPGINVHPLFRTKFLLFVNRNNPLSRKHEIFAEDLEGETLQIGGRSAGALVKVQQQIMNAVSVNTYHAVDAMTMFIDVAAGKCVAIAEAFFTEESDEIVGIPFHTNYREEFVLCTHAYDQRPALSAFIRILQSFYSSEGE